MVLLGKGEDTESLRQILCDTILMLCNNTMAFESELSVEGLLGITLDNRDVVLVNIKEFIKHKNGLAAQSTDADAGKDGNLVVKSIQKKKHEKASHVIRDCVEKDISNEASDPVVLDEDIAVGTMPTLSAYSCTTGAGNVTPMLASSGYRNKKRAVEDPESYLENDELDEGPIKLKLKKIHGVYEDSSADIVTDVKEEPPDQKNTEELKNARFTVTYQRTSTGSEYDSEQYIGGNQSLMDENGHFGAQDYLVGDDSFLRPTPDALADDSPSKSSLGGGAYRHVCSQCNYSCDKKFNMDRHVTRKHMKKTSLECPICHKQFKDRWYIQYSHIPVCHPEHAAAAAIDGMPSNPHLGLSSDVGSENATSPPPAIDHNVSSPVIWNGELEDGDIGS